MSIELKQAAQRAIEMLTASSTFFSTRSALMTDECRAAAEELRTAIQQATQAEVTDEQIAACVKRASTYGLPFVGLLNPGGTPSEFSKRFTAEILALRPERVPMTPASRDVIMATRTANADADEWPEPWAYQRGWNDAEAHHGITAQAKKEGA